MSNEQMWYALYTRPCWEKKVSRILELKQIEHYCPLQKTIRQWSDRKKILYEPLFKSYVFVRINFQSHNTVLQTEGVLNFVSFQGKPAKIRDEEIYMIRQFLLDYSDVRIEEIHFEINDTVKIISGALNSKTGTILNIKKKTVQVLLPSLGFAMIAEIKKEKLKKYLPGTYQNT